MNFFKDRKRVALVLGIFLLVVGTAGAVFIFRPNPHIARYEKLRKQLSSENAQKLTSEQRSELRGQMGKEREQLPPAEKRKIWQERSKRFNEPIIKYFALSTKEEKTAFLDNQINEQQKWEAAFEERRRERAQNGGGTQGGGGTTGSGGNSGQRSGSTGDQGGSGGGNTGAGGPGRGSRDADERRRMRKEMLDFSTPEERSKASEYFKQLSARRKELGLPDRSQFGRAGRPF